MSCNYEASSKSLLLSLVPDKCNRLAVGKILVNGTVGENQDSDVFYWIYKCNYLLVL